MGETVEGVILVLAMTSFCIALGVGPSWAVSALKETKQWKRIVFALTGIALLPGIGFCAWSFTLEPEAMGWGFLFSCASLIFWPWVVALILGILHFLLNVNKDPKS
jgi:hypothetical protein